MKSSSTHLFLDVILIVSQIILNKTVGTHKIIFKHIIFKERPSLPLNLM